MEKQSVICIVCPVGCHLAVEKGPNDGYRVTGNQCQRGETYGIDEFTNPTRILTTTIKIKNAVISRLPVRTERAIPKGKIRECMDVLNKVEVSAPIRIGTLIVENILGTGVNVIASRSMQ